MIKKFIDYIKEDNDFNHITSPEDEIVAFFTQHPRFGIDDVTGSLGDDPDDDFYGLTIYDITDNADPKTLVAANRGTPIVPPAYIQLFFDKAGNIDDMTEEKPSDKDWIDKEIRKMKEINRVGGMKIPTSVVNDYLELYKILSEWL